MLLAFAVAFLLKRYGTQAVSLPTPDSFYPVLDAFTVFTRDDHSTSDGCHRSVLSIVWSCLATTLACTWISVNVPSRGECFWTILGSRIYIILFSIVAPEYMVMWAFKQWRGAVMIRETVNRAIEGSNPVSGTYHSGDRSTYR